MPSLIRRLVLIAASLCLLTEAAPHSGRSCGKGDPAVGKAIYILTNDNQNAVVALPISTNGTLSAGSVTSTGGCGSNAIDGSTNASAGPDALLSQSALTVVGQHIFAVNAGSNTISMLRISSQDPTKLTLIGRPVAVPGDFPNTIAASAAHNLVCVGSTGAHAGISCSSFSASTGLGAMDALRPFDIGQSTPPVGPTNTVSQTFFSADESRLFTTVKGNPAANTTGFFSVFRINSGRGAQKSTLSTRETRTSPPGTAVLFGSALVPGTNSVFATDASFGAAVLSLNTATDAASLVAKQAIDGQKATCWATISPATGTAFVTDVALARVVEMSVTDASIVSTVDLAGDGDTGFIDLKAAGGFVYALAPGNGTGTAAVTVLDVRGGRGKARMVQRFGMEGLGFGRNAQGMAVLV